MDYSGIVYEKDACILKDVRHFEPARIFECGQSFRFWEKNGVYETIAFRRRVFLEKRGRDVALYPCTPEDFHGIWEDYLDLRRSYEELCEGFSGDEELREGLCFGRGLRILRQQPFETLVSFIISANNNIGRIKGIVARICERFGSEMEDGYGRYFAFPESFELARAKRADFIAMGAGYRADYLQKTVALVAGGRDLRRIGELPYEEAKKQLLSFPGVGPKVADCVLLFGYGFGCAFPVDVWVRRSMERFVGEGAGEEEIRRYARERFSETAGLAQQYLFFYQRGQKGKKDGA